MVNSYRYAFAATTSVIPSSGTTADLGTGEIGVFDGSTYTATSGLSAKSIIVAQGVPATLYPQGVAKGNFSVKTDIIKGNAVKSWKRVTGRKGRGIITTMGFDGVDTGKGLTVKSGDSFTFWITLSGSPIDNLLGSTPETHYASWTEQFTVILPCVADCTDTCGTYVDQNIVADAAIDQINLRKLPGGQLLTDYIKPTKLLSCSTPSGLPNVTYTVYTLTIADNGTQADQGAVEAQYPGLDIKRIKRNGIFSTYEITKLTTDGAPAAYSNYLNPVLSNCDTCPSGCPTGYTSTVAQDAYIVQRPLSGSTDLTTTAARTSYKNTLISGSYTTATAGEFLSFNGSVASVKLYFPTGTVVAAFLSDTVVLIETNASICTQTYILTTAWQLCKVCTAVKKNYVISLANSCERNYLTDLRAIYGSGVTLVSNNTATCTSQFNLPVLSDNLDCDACDDTVWKFTTPAPFEGVTWTQVVQTGYGTTCIAGIKVESIYEQRKAKECFLKQVAYEFEPLFISFSTRNPDPNNFAVLCETDVPVTLVQNVTYPRGVGRVVADHVIASNYAFNQPWRKDAAERDAFEYELGIDLQGLYDEYILEYNTFPDTFGASHFGTTQVQTFEWAFYFPKGTGGSFENIISAFLAGNSQVVLEDI